MRVMVENIGEEEICLTPVAAIPLFARSADHIREHRNATSMLHRIFTMKDVTGAKIVTSERRPNAAEVLVIF